jgi:hypothetical protein
MIGTMFVVEKSRVRLSALVSAVCCAHTEVPQTTADKCIQYITSALRRIHFTLSSTIRTTVQRHKVNRTARFDENVLI